MNLNVRPFPVPTDVYLELPPKSKQEGFNPIAISIKDVDVETLDHLCIEFRSNVFLMAGKDDSSSK